MLMTEVYKPRKNGNYILIEKRKKHAARKRVKYALKTGKLEQLPCEYADCTEQNTEAHHHSYDEPLSVLWLCRLHHVELHKMLLV